MGHRRYGERDGEGGGKRRSRMIPAKIPQDRGSVDHTSRTSARKHSQGRAEREIRILRGNISYEGFMKVYKKNIVQEIHYGLLPFPTCRDHSALLLSTSLKKETTRRPIDLENGSFNSLVSPIMMLEVNNLLRAQLLLKCLSSLCRDIRKARLVSLLSRRTARLCRRR